MITRAVHDWAFVWLSQQLPVDFSSQMTSKEETDVTGFDHHADEAE